VSDPWRPLEGIRVTDFFWLIAGPATSRVLADYGAEVIKIETAARPDQIRQTGIWPPGASGASANAVFADCNTNKQSITLNLSDSRGIELAKELVRNSDIVTNNFTGERMDRWGLGYDDLVQVKPDIIMLTMPVMGTTGPYRSYGAFGGGVIAYGGLNTNMGFPGREPVGMGPRYSDFSTPYAAVSALMAALHHRDRTGEGQFIDIAQAQATVGLLGTGVIEHSATGEVPPPPGNRARDYCPHGAYRCAGDDRWLAIAVRGDDDWRGLCAAVDAPDLATDPRFATHDARKANEDALDALIEGWTSQREAWAAMHELQAAGVIASVVSNVEDLITRDPHMRERHFEDVEDISGEFVHTIHRQPSRIDGQTPPLKRPPTLGEHNEAVFKGLLGVSDDDYVELLAGEVIN
jgi:benzylsuccinate CoA-transferase BbsF subunit